LPDPPNQSGIGALIERLLKAGLDRDDQDFLEKLSVNNRLIAIPQLNPAEKLEGILSEKQTERWRSASFLYRGAQCLKAVCRVETTSGPLGTGFLVAPDLVLTNYHVLMLATDEADEPETKAVNLRFRFGYLEEGGHIQPGQAVLPANDQKIVVAASVNTEYDFALLRVKEPLGGRLGYLPIEARELVPDEEVFILQHPAGWEMQFMGGKVAKFDSRRVRYTINTLGGTSGSPVFDREWRLVALHCGSGETANRGVPMLSIYPLISSFLA
jgi:endonuclease G, mitochondrial